MQMKELFKVIRDCLSVGARMNKPANCAERPKTFIRKQEKWSGEYGIKVSHSSRPQVDSQQTRLEIYTLKT